MPALAAQGGIITTPDDPASDGGNYGEPSRPDTNATSSVQPPALPLIGSNDANKVK